MLCLLVVVPVAAQVPAEGSGQVRQVDVGDLWRMAHHREAAPETEAGPTRRTMLFIPSVSSKPSTGISGGLSVKTAFRVGDAATTRLSTLGGGFDLSQKKQASFDGQLVMFAPADAWFVACDGRVSWTSGDTYALGTDAPSITRTSTAFDVFKVYASAYRRVWPGLFVGGGLNVSSHVNVRAGTTGGVPFSDSAYVAYSEQYGFSSATQHSGGTSVGLRYDTRDNVINAVRGLLAGVTYRTFFGGFLGGDSTWQELALDVRTYRKITASARHRLALWFLGDLVTGGTAPYWDLPAVGADGRSARGYADGRYRGNRLLYWEAEYRGTLTSNGLLGMVLFANLATVDDPRTHGRLFESFAPGAGLGLRVLLSKRSHTNACIDWGWGKQGSHGFYLALQETF